MSEELMAAAAAKIEALKAEVEAQKAAVEALKLSKSVPAMGTKFYAELPAANNVRFTVKDYGFHVMGSVLINGVKYSLNGNLRKKGS